MTNSEIKKVKLSLRWRTTKLLLH